MQIYKLKNQKPNQENVYLKLVGNYPLILFDEISICLYGYNFRIFNNLYGIYMGGRWGYFGSN